MSTLKEIQRTIDRFFPKGVKPDGDDYLNSKEYQNLKLKKEEAILQTHFKKGITSAFPEYVVSDWTDLPDSNCYEYRVLLHKNQPILDDDIDLINVLGGKRRDLCLFISIPDKYYFYHFLETSYNDGDWGFRKIVNYDTEMNKVQERLQLLMKSEGYTELSTEIVSMIVEGVKTEFHKKREVRVFHCLFADLYDNCIFDKVDE